MGHNKKHSRLYSEKDIGRLIQRATELQQQNESTERGLSLDEIKQFAAELGVDPIYMEQAASDLEESNVEGSGITITGAPFHTSTTRVVEGFIEDDQWDEMILQLRSLEGVRGEVSDFGKIREWVYEFDGLFSTRVSVSPRDEQTVIEIRKDHRGMAYMAYFVSIFIGVTLAGIALDGSGLSDVLTYTLAGSGGLGGLASVRVALSLWKKNQVEKVKNIASRVVETLGRVGAETSPALVDAEPSGEIEIPDQEQFEALKRNGQSRSNGQIKA